LAGSAGFAGVAGVAWANTAEVNIMAIRADSFFIWVLFLKLLV
jgi:hypothetical protein